MPIDHMWMCYCRSNILSSASFVHIYLLYITVFPVYAAICFVFPENGANIRKTITTLKTNKILNPWLEFITYVWLELRKQSLCLMFLTS